MGRGVFDFRPRLLGSGRLPTDPTTAPAGGWIAAGFPHRTWVDPFLVADQLPRDPRLIFFGDGIAIHRSWWRRLAVRVVGGVIPIWPGGGRAAVEAHLAAATTVLRAGSVLVVFPEVGPPSPLGEARPFGLGLAYFALRTGAPIVPLVIGGGHELYRGRRLVLEVLAPVTARELIGIGPDAPLPEPWSSEERRAAHLAMARLAERSAPAVARVHALAEVDPPTRRRWTWLTTAWH
jgi:1-acyl-sn-glycerol-3-phosphate acyltransferase